MDFTSAYSLIVFSVGSFGASAIIVLAAVIGVAVGLLVFRWGWRKFVLSTMHDPYMRQEYKAGRE
jgi:hypothetical protein